MSNFEFIAAFTVILVISSAPALAVLWRIRTHRGAAIFISKRRLLFATMTATPIGWLSTLVPGVSVFVFPFLLIAVILFVLRQGALDLGNVEEESGVVLGNLKRIQEDLSAAELHLQDLSTRIQLSQRDITDKESQRVTLQREIEKQLRDVEEWQKLSQGQKELFVQVAKQAMRRRNFMESAALVCGGLALNLAASIIWTLMGAPGKQELMSFFARFHI